MSRNLCIVSTCALALFFCLPGGAQDSPSLGDLARQAQKDKASKPVAKVFTNDDMSSASGGASSALGGSAGPSAQGGPGGNAAAQKPEQMLERLQTALDHLDSLDRSSLASDVLEGNDSEFPGRVQWEEKLFVAKRTFVAQTRTILQKAQQLTASSGAIKDAQDASDAHAKILNDKLNQLLQQFRQISADFQAVVAEGKSMAAHADAAH